MHNNNTSYAKQYAFLFNTFVNECIFYHYTSNVVYLNLKFVFSTKIVNAMVHRFVTCLSLPIQTDQSYHGQDIVCAGSILHKFEYHCNLENIIKSFNSSIYCLFQSTCLFVPSRCLL